MSNKICPVCNGSFFTEGEFENRLCDGTAVCEKCAAKTRFLYPVGKDTEKKRSRGAFNNGEYDVESYTTYETTGLVNPVEKMTLEEFKQALEETDLARAGIAAKYEGFKCALLVDDSERVIVSYTDRMSLEDKYKDSMQFSLTGRVIYGELHKGDTLIVQRKEREETVEVPFLKNSPAGGSKSYMTDVVYEGSYANTSVARDLSFIYPGDVLIVK